MEDKRLKELKKEYLAVPIPEELDLVVKKSLKEGGRKMKKTKAFRWIGVIAASFALFTATINISPAFARSLAEVPGMENVIKVLTFKGYTLNEETYKADLKVPVLDGLRDKSLESTLNTKYLEENKKLYEDFIADIADLKKQGLEGHMGIDTGYEVKTDNDQIFSIGRYVLNTAGSSSTVFKYDTIDKKNQLLITLPSLFKDEQYIPVISEYIQEQMRQQMLVDEGIIYWVTGAGLENPFDSFESIAKDQSFYINPDGKLVISFDKYEVAPGYMGVVEFVIPSEILADLLVSNDYLH
jgi:hypothetical protein